MAAPSRRSLLLALLLVAGAPALVGAEPGQAEISQATALAGGVTSGDAPGFPVSIRQSGSYRLTSDLLVRGASAPDTDGIRIEADGVTLDLAGFAVRCERPGIPLPFPCPGSGGVGDGIELVGAEHVRIEGGRIAGFARHGVVVGTGSDGFQLHDLIVHGNGALGISSRAVGRIERSVIGSNGSFAISSVAGSLTIVGTLTTANQGGLQRTGGGAAAARSAFTEGLTNVFSGDLLGCVLAQGTVSCPP